MRGSHVTPLPRVGLFLGIVRWGHLMARMHRCRGNHDLGMKNRTVASRARALSFAFLGIGVLSGCHIFEPFDRAAFPLDSAQFMDTWKTYLHCRSSVDPEEIRSDLQQLTHVAQTVSRPNHDSVRLLPAVVRTLITTLPSRLAVDPHAMSVACALHGGEVAKAAGLPGLSVVLLTAVVAAQSGAVNASYAVEARHRLEGMEW